MKKTLLIIAALAAFGLTATAQIGAPATIITSGTGEAYAAITNNTSCTFTNAIIDCTKGTYVCLQLKAELHTTGTTANSMTLQGSNDKVNWSSSGTPPFPPAIAWTPASTTAVITVTNISVQGMAYLRIRTLANANANTDSHMTNYTVKAWVK
jgi:hypothetical protein